MSSVRKICLLKIECMICCKLLTIVTVEVIHDHIFLWYRIDNQWCQLPAELGVSLNKEAGMSPPKCPRHRRHHCEHIQWWEWHMYCQDHHSAAGGETAAWYVTSNEVVTLHAPVPPDEGSVCYQSAFTDIFTLRMTRASNWYWTQEFYRPFCSISSLYVLILSWACTQNLTIPTCITEFALSWIWGSTVILVYKPVLCATDPLEEAEEWKDEDFDFQTPGFSTKSASPAYTRKIINPLGGTPDIARRAPQNVDNLKEMFPNGELEGCHWDVLLGTVEDYIARTALLRMREIFDHAQVYHTDTLCLFV